MDRYPVWLTDEDINVLVASLSLSKTVGETLSGVPEENKPAFNGEIDILTEKLRSAQERRRRRVAR